MRWLKREWHTGQFGQEGTEILPSHYKCIVNKGLVQNCDRNINGGICPHKVDITT